MLKFSDYTKQPVVKKLNENVVQKGNVLTVTFTYDMSLDVVEEYRKKVKSEDDKNLLVQFSGAVIAEKMIKYTLDQFMTVDNIPSDAFIDSAKEEGPVVAETDSAAEEPKQETQPEEPKKEAEKPAEEPVAKSTEVDFDNGKEEEVKQEEEEESNYLNLYTTMGNPVSTGFKLNSPTHKSPKNAKVGLYEGLTDADIK